TTTTTMAARPATTSAPAPSAPAARAPRPAPGPPPPPPPGLGVGARGPEVLALEQRLDTLHYDTGAVDGLFDSNTAFAVTALQKSRLGMLFNPLYFNGGIAIHGAPSVPPYPASHGCVRIPLGASHWFPALVPNGTPVYVKGVGNAPVPFNEPAPNGAPPN